MDYSGTVLSYACLAHLHRMVALVAVAVEVVAVAEGVVVLLAIRLE